MMNKITSINVDQIEGPFTPRSTTTPVSGQVGLPNDESIL